MPTRAGQFNQRIWIQRRGNARDALGQLISAWANITPALPAKIEADTGGESIENQQVVAQQNYRVTIRRRTGIETTDRVMWGTKVLHILAIANAPNDPTGRELVMSCRG